MKKSDTEIKDEIINAASKLIIKYGYSKTTMEDIAKAARKGKSTLYYYYKSKDEIVKDVISDYYNKKIIKELNECLKTGASAKDIFNNYFITTIRHVKAVTGAFYILKDEIKDNLSLIMELRNLINKQTAAILSEIITLGVNNKEFLRVESNLIEKISILIDDITGLIISKGVIEEQNNDWEDNLYLFSQLILSGF